MSLHDAEAGPMDLIDPEVRKLMDAMKEQLLIVFANRLGGEVRVAVSEIDDTGKWLMNMRLEGRTFIFTTEKKQ